MFVSRMVRRIWPELWREFLAALIAFFVVCGFVFCFFFLILASLNR